MSGAHDRGMFTLIIPLVISRDFDESLTAIIVSATGFPIYPPI